MKIRRFIPKRKLQATARRLPQRGAIEDFSQEPNMSFVKALIVVVVLHLVAVGGIYTFHSIEEARKSSQTGLSIHPGSDTHDSQTETKPAVSSLKTMAKVTDTHQVGQSERTPVKTAPKVVIEPVKPAEPPHRKVVEEPAKGSAKQAPVSPKDSGEVYTVVKGDNPVAIAKKFHVSYDELLKLNKIDNPKKLQIDQKLRIPVKIRKQ